MRGSKKRHSQKTKATLTFAVPRYLYLGGDRRTNHRLIKHFRSLEAAQLFVVEWSLGMLGDKNAYIIGEHAREENHCNCVTCYDYNQVKLLSLSTETYRKGQCVKRQVINYEEN